MSICAPSSKQSCRQSAVAIPRTKVEISTLANTSSMPLMMRGRDIFAAFSCSSQLLNGDGIKAYESSGFVQTE